MTTNVELSGRATRDLRRMAKGSGRERVVDALRGLANGAANLDVKALEGRPPWRRLRAGDHRLIYRSTEVDIWVERIVTRSDLERAITTL